MKYKDYYKILGVAREASQDEVKRAYRKLARKYHPDVSKEPDAEARFKELGEAYEVLKDPEKRAAYNQLGANWKSGQDFRPPPDWNAGFEFQGGGFNEGEAAAFSDFFESLFGREFRQGQGGRPASRDHHARVLIELEDSFNGATRQITLHAPATDGRGSVERSLNLRIPKGIKPGQRIRLAGQGGNGDGVPAGDLYLEVEFRPHPYYRVDGADIYIDLPVAPWEAALGANVKVPTPGGKVDLKLPPNSEGGKKLRLKGRGIPARQPGDLYVVLRIRLPRADDETSREFYRRMEREMAFNPRSDLGV